VSSGEVAEADVVLGAVVCLLMDALAGERLLDAWTAGRSTLRGEVLPRSTPQPVEAVAS
jgi:hypothetical protein